MAERPRIPLFDGTNFSNWKFRIETLLTQIDLLSFVMQPYTEMVELLDTDTAVQRAAKKVQFVENQKRDKKCMSNIIQNMADSHICEYAKDKETAFDLWKTLCETFERRGNTKTAEGSAYEDTLNEILIGAVKARKELYDNSIAASEKTKLRKNALWVEVSNTLEEALSPEEAKARWKNLRYSYAAARKRLEGSSGLKKSMLKFYDLMTFLNDFLKTRQTVSSLPDDVAKSEIYATPEQQENDTASSSGSIDIPPRTPTTIHASLPMLTPTRVPLRTSTPTLVPPRISTPNSVTPRTPPALSMTSRISATNSKRPLQTVDYDLDVPRQTPVAKKQKRDALQVASIEALKEPTMQAADPLDGFLARLREGMRRLPYRDRGRLEIQFLKLLAETEDLCAN